MIYLYYKTYRQTMSTAKIHNNPFITSRLQLLIGGGVRNTNIFPSYIN